MLRELDFLPSEQLCLDSWKKFFAQALEIFLVEDGGVLGKRSLLWSIGKAGPEAFKDDDVSLVALGGTRMKKEAPSSRPHHLYRPHK